MGVTREDRHSVWSRTGTGGETKHRRHREQAGPPQDSVRTV